MAEWSKAAVLKTAVVKATGGSNPFSSAATALRDRLTASLAEPLQRVALVN